MLLGIFERTGFVCIDENEDVFVRERAEIDGYCVDDDRRVRQTESAGAVAGLPYD